MQTKVITPVSRLDALDVQRFESMLGSEPFTRFLLRVQGELLRSREDCETQPAELAVRQAQGSVRAYRTVLRLPELMLAEMKKGKE